MSTEFPIVYLFGVAMELVADGVVRPLRRRGRPFATGNYGEPTKLVRVPVSLLPELKEKMESLKAQVSSQRPTADNPYFTSPCIDLNNLRVDYSSELAARSIASLKSPIAAPVAQSAPVPAQSPAPFVKRDRRAKRREKRQNRS